MESLENEAIPRKKSKLTYSELYKPPTNEELTNLHETTSMFGSNLVKLQIKEILAEISISKKQRLLIDDYLHSLHDVIMAVPSREQTTLNDHRWLGNVRFPFVENPRRVKGNMIFMAPVDIKVVGSYQLDTGLNQHVDVDLLIVMSQACMQEKDIMNQRYFRKRASYLAYIADYLHGNDLVSKVNFSYFCDETMKPVVHVTPHDPLKHITIRLHARPEVDFKLERFLPSKNNVRWNWFHESKDEEPFHPTPHYNNLMLMDQLMEPHLTLLHQSSKDFPEFKNAIKLIKTWLHQRELNKGFGCFSGFIASMLLHHLLTINKINNTMSSFQIVRNFFQFIATSDWKTHGIGTNNETILKEFHDHHEVVFVDGEGRINFCAGMPALLYDLVRHEAESSLTALDSPQGFNVVFIVCKPKLLKQLRVSIDRKLADTGGQYITSMITSMSDALVHGLGHRVVLCGVRTHSYKQWSINENPPTWYQVSTCLSFGLNLNEDFAFDQLEKGPSADSAEATKFRDFWGEVSELRRFKDGSVCESVLWGVGGREVPTHVCKHVLLRNCGIPPSALSFSTNQVEDLITLPRKRIQYGKVIGYSGTGDEVVTTATRSYNELARTLRDLKTLPLTITHVQGVSPVLRNTEVYPTPPFETIRVVRTIEVGGVKREIPVPGEPCPAFTQPIQVQCSLEGSGSWPQDPHALRRLKAAFHIAIVDELKPLFPCVTSQSYIDLIKDGFVFRISMVYPREVVVLQTHRTKEGMVRVRDTKESIELEKNIVKLPQLSSLLQGVHQRFHSFGRCCRVTKRWINSMMLSGHINDEVVDLLCSFIYLSPSPYNTPGSAQVGFLRFLHFVSTFDFNSTPVVVDFNDELTNEDINHIHTHFLTNRTSLPPISIMNNKDRLASPWSTSGPSKIILRRMKDLARISLVKMEGQISGADKDINFKTILNPSLSAYDVIIRLKSQWLPRRFESEQYKPLKRNNTDCSNVCNDCLPVVNFDPMQLYIDDLKASFSELAMFFYDTNGGCLVGVLWKPTAFQPKPFNASSSSCILQQDGNVVPDVPSVIEDFKILGDGLVDSIDLISNKWKI
ncbi:nucleolar protein 6-like [Ciona intestinalis]